MLGGKKPLHLWRLILPNSAFFKMTLMSVEGHSIPPAKGPGCGGRSCSPCRKRAQGGLGSASFSHALVWLTFQGHLAMLTQSSG